MRGTFATAWIALAAAALTGCGPSRAPVGGTEASPAEAELCRAWGGALPTRSRADTGRTQDEIEAGYGDFAAACPNWKHLIPEGET